MLALEDAFDIEFPDSLLRKSTFESVAEIRNALESLGVTVSADA
jgi:acyl carrier protein